MIHVDGRSMIVMESVTERMRLKDKIVANVAKSVKSIQELQMLAGGHVLTLGNEDWQCHRLCEHLDHTLLHGLRHITPGYWKIVTEFTHKDCIKEIKRMRNVTTDLGRGRAWLFTALNENLLECYLRCFQQNESLVEEYYVRDALVRDHDRFNVLLTLTSGLENISFNQECDVPYLDLCVHPPKSQRISNVEATAEFDRLSVCSMESLHFPTTNTKPLPQTVFESQDTYGMPYKPADKDTGSIGSGCSRDSPSIDSGVHSDWNYRQRSITPIDQLGSTATAGENENESNSGELEVIRLSKKGKPHKHKKKKKRFVSVSSIIEPDMQENSVSDGPAIEIPPIDDFKLLCAIQGSQSTDTNSGKQFSTGARTPGDGRETPADKAGSVGKISNASGMSKDVHESGNVINDSSTNETGRMTPNRDSGIFTEMIKAKVMDIVEAGDKQDAVVVDSDLSNSSSKDVTDSKVRFDNGYKLKHNESGEFLEDMNGLPSYIYDCKDVDDEEETKYVQVNEIEVNNVEVEEIPVTEEPSIYGPSRDSDSSSDVDFDFSPAQDLTDLSDSKPASRPSSATLLGTAASRSGDTPSRSSNPPRSTSSTPIAPVVNDLKKSQSNSSVKSVGHSSENHSMDDVLSSTAVDSEKIVSSETEQKNNSRRNTPDFLTASRSRPSSAKSNSSSNPGHRDSPMESADEDKLSYKTRSTNPTPDSEIAASESVLQAKVEELIEHKSLNTFTHLTFGEEDDEEEEEVDRTRCESARSLRAGEVELDNNSMLYLMLDIIEGEETFVRLFCCRQGHTEGKTKTVFVLVTTNSLYILQQQQSRKRFTKLSEISFTDIDFVSLGYNNQIIHIACKNKWKKHWLTTGEERVTIALVDCLADSMENSNSHPARLEVDTGNTVQKISLHKYLAAECRCDVDEIEMVLYSLVHWEDPMSSTASCEWDREGTLYYKSIETASILGTQTWRLAYAVLKDSMLCLYNDKSDAKPSHFLSMSGGECVGCKRDFNADKNNAIKIMMEDGSFWTIAFETEDEANRWLQGLCQAVSEGLQMNTVRPSCIPCCMLLCKQKVLMCHEDLDTNFLRTLGSASVSDITAIIGDDLHRTYLILVFDSPDDIVSSEKWVLYFNSEHECHRFQTALADCWAKHYQVEVPVLAMDDFALQKKCQHMASYLKTSITLN